MGIIHLVWASLKAFLADRAAFAAEHLDLLTCVKFSLPTAAGCGRRNQGCGRSRARSNRETGPRTKPTANGLPPPGDTLAYPGFPGLADEKDGPACTGEADAGPPWRAGFPPRAIAIRGKRFLPPFYPYRPRLAGGLGYVC